MMKCLFVLVAFCVALSQGWVYQGSLDFSGNATVSQQLSNFNFRENLVSFSTGVFVDVSAQVNFNANANSNGGNFSGNEMVVIGMTLIVDSFSLPPVIIAAFVNESGTVSVSDDVASMSFNGTAAVVGKAYDSLVEVDATGNIVNTISFGSLSWSNNGLVTVSSTQGLQYVSFVAESGSATIAISIAVSAVIGTLNNGGSIITPTSVESFFEVNGYTFANSGNHLRLVMYTGQFSESIAVTGNSQLVAGSGNYQAYVNFSETAQINGQSASVTVSGFADIDITPPSITTSVGGYMLYTYMSTSGASKSAFCQITVDFPVGESNFTYDPTVGFGSPYTSGSSAPSSGNNDGNGSKPNSGSMLNPASLFAVFAFLITALVAFLA